MVATPQRLQAALASLYRRHTFGIKLGLHVEEALLAALGNPHQGLRCVHVAGTNGKGSVCAVLDGIFRAAGMKTGRYTSPHLIRFNERICINGTPITDEELLPLVDLGEQAAATVSQALGQDPTFFEVTTALAFRHFRDRAVDVVLLETGMGGRLDATNVVDPLVAVITTIGMDHMAYLGNDLESIAREKCGIIKPGRPVVSGVREEPARSIIRADAAGKKARLIEAWETVAVQIKKAEPAGQKIVIESAGGLSGTVRLPLQGPHQADNLAVALAVVEVLLERGTFALPMEIIRRGIEQTTWPGRCQILSRDPLVILDGAHNPPAARRLAESLRQIGGGIPVGLVCGFCGDKDVRGYLQALGGGVKRAWFVPIASERNIARADLHAAASGLRWELADASLAEALELAKAWARETGGMVCVTGSLFLVGEVLEMLGMDAV
ncbi:MAG: bifunctional folylpolyglutamate synthase/dihydrofolate synthase [Lentisphaerae bacterium]|nr:bifunctional folylpolyglutamate synthase/dihydrofolate synthase [Lentisphaerota bacterium]